MKHFCSDFVQNPLTFQFLQTAPQPISDASDKISNEYSGLFEEKKSRKYVWFPPFEIRLIRF